MISSLNRLARVLVIAPLLEEVAHEGYDLFPRGTLVLAVQQQIWWQRYEYIVYYKSLPELIEGQEIPYADVVTQIQEDQSRRSWFELRR